MKESPLTEKFDPAWRVHAQAVKDGMVPLTKNELSPKGKRNTSLSEMYRVRLDN